MRALRLSVGRTLRVLRGRASPKVKERISTFASISENVKGKCTAFAALDIPAYSAIKGKPFPCAQRYLKRLLIPSTTTSGASTNS